MASQKPATLNPPGGPAGARKFETFSQSHREQLALGGLPGSRGKAKKPPKARITVTVRKRPLTPVEVTKGESDIIECNSKKDIVIKEPRKHMTGQVYIESHQFKFDRVYDDRCSNKEVYNSCVKTLVDAVFEHGCRASCFAYGQTGSGKTYTMVGPKKMSSRSAKEVREDERGLWEWAAIDLMHWMDLPEWQGYGLFCSFFEIYCNKVYDLLAERKLVRALETKTTDGVVVKDLTVSRVEHEDDMLGLMDRGLQARVVAKNSRNNDSSRGHAIFTIELKHIEQQLNRGKLAFIDLAGSERGADSMAAGRTTQTDGAGINKSLLALKECIRAMDQGSSHIPFRDAELTKVLRDMFLAESALTLMIANVSPTDGCCEQTLNTMRYADRVFGLRKNCKPCIAESSVDGGNSGIDDADEEEPSGFPEDDDYRTYDYNNSPRVSTSTDSLADQSPASLTQPQRCESELVGAPAASRNTGSTNKSLQQRRIPGGQRGSVVLMGGLGEDCGEPTRSSLIYKGGGGLQSPRGQATARVGDDVLSASRQIRTSGRRPATAGGSSVASSIAGGAVTKGAAVRTGRSRGPSVTQIPAGLVTQSVTVAATSGKQAGRETLSKTTRGPLARTLGLEDVPTSSSKRRTATGTGPVGTRVPTTVVEDATPSNTESSSSGESSGIGGRRRHHHHGPGARDGRTGRRPVSASRMPPLEEGPAHLDLARSRPGGWLTTALGAASAELPLDTGGGGKGIFDRPSRHAAARNCVLLGSMEDGDEFDDLTASQPPLSSPDLLSFPPTDPRSAATSSIGAANPRDLVRRVLDPPPDPSVRLASSWNDDDLKRGHGEFGSVAWQEWRRMMSEYSRMMTSVTSLCLQHVNLSKSMDDMVQTNNRLSIGAEGPMKSLGGGGGGSSQTTSTTATSSGKESLKSINVDPGKLKEVRETVESQLTALIHFGQALTRAEAALSNYDQVEREMQRRTVQSVQYYGAAAAAASGGGGVSSTTSTALSKRKGERKLATATAMGSSNRLIDA